jgi:nucleotide-binding universal stress UspA family protein
MVVPTRSAPIVVAVGEHGDGQALEWAAAEAGARGCALQVVHAMRLRWAVDPWGLVPVADFWSYRLAAEELLAEAVERARTMSPDLEVSGHLVVGPPVASVVAQGRGARLLVLGSHPAAHLRVLTGFSVVGRVAGRAPCPVAVVPPLPRGGDGTPPRVVAGVTGSAASAAALDFAFRAAAQRGLGVTAVLVGPPEDRAREVLERALDRRPAECADVPVELRPTTPDPGAALIRQSRGAALVVLGRGSGSTRRTRRVGRDVLRQARCPVVVLRPDAGTRTDTAGLGRSTTATDRVRTDRVRHPRAAWE